MTNHRPARSTHTSYQPATTGTAWTTPEPTHPKASTQPQRIAGQHQRTTEERQHPGERAEGDSNTRPQSQHPGEREDTRQGGDCGQSLHPRKPAQQPRPAGEQRDTQPPPADAIPSQPDSRASETGEKEERPENDSKRAPPSLRPRQNHRTAQGIQGREDRPGAPPMLPAVPAYKAREQPRKAPEAKEINSAFVEYAELPLTNAAHAIPGEARQGGRFTF